ncbi:MAG: isopenicillin N synthase family oxygenase [Rhodospirillaceae bacterium]|jgi:isopenicillin N synthase-like dioxygenase|nr:isopenicillin N synthase family oxygenase [Rhodospirillaceae bacterium]MBT4046488.1 isopenicillin N synthase family oxygenase [Rhodospirillaceae bacterium]MBT4687698.1 isopenicillin N synthase family oxygenase [Rhodospirillaceae bacterium]MBT5082878.1 isopenicillin N synthase family oxygenase [Rhodospirillaceae bacterium]MBT5524322.1 isopenicillin N synthase family oxygenase [Rhodospirillaceae bacterium]
MVDQTFDIPVIDIASLDSSDSADQAIAAQVRVACMNSGFFYVSGHGIDPDLLTGAFAANRSFHARPLEEKLSIKLNAWHRGYQAFATSKLVSSERFEAAVGANQMESYFLRHEVPTDDPTYQAKALMGPNQWPDDPDFRDAVGGYNGAVVDLGMRLLRIFALAVGEAEDYFLPYFDGPITCLRLLHYPAMKETPATGDVDLYGINPHTDYGFITILAQDEVGGLEIQAVDGTWLPAPSLPGTLIVNIADALARWTNGVFNSTPHRVINKTNDRSRYSVAMFFDPNFDADIECLDQFIENGGSAKHSPIRYGEYLQERLDSNFPDRTG